MKNVYLLGDDGTRVQAVDETQDAVHYNQHAGNCFNNSHDGGILRNKVAIRDFAVEIKKLSFMFEAPQEGENIKFFLDNIPSPFPNKHLVDYSEVVHPDGTTFLKVELNYAIIKDSVVDTVVNHLENEIKIKDTYFERSLLDAKMYRNERDEKQKSNTVLNGRLLGIEARDKKPSFSFVIFIIKNYLKNIFSVK
jgi:hypothetical protein